MKAIQMRAAGDSSVLEHVDIDEPVIQTPSEVKVKLKAAGVNPIDTKIRATAGYYPDQLPAVLGCDGAGVIVEIGDAVKQFKVGDEVWFCHGGLGNEQGNYAEFNVLEEHLLSHKPASLDFSQAAAGPLVLITAWEALYDRVQLDDRKTILIHAGAGGVGHVAIQLAKRKGARVFTTVHGQEKIDFVRSLGADEVILYRDEDVAARINELTGGKGVDVVFDTVGPAVFKQSLQLLAYRGEIVTLLDPGTDIDWKEARLKNIRVSFELMLTPMVRSLPQARRHQVEILNQCAEWIDRGELQLKLAASYPLSQAASVHQLIEQGHTMGKISLVIQ
ncbi:MAG: zinc-dependent alcohol dehydrogenase family protein [Thioalkalispiraceae bacterium]|jgi:NADPH2:quinone reductase